MFNTVRFLVAALATAAGIPGFAGQGQKVDLPAPQVSGTNQDGKTINFSDVFARGSTLVFFYPKAGTGG